MAINDGYPVDAANSNPAWVSKNTADTVIAKTGWNSGLAQSGPAWDDVQREVNSLDSFTGRILGSAFDVKPAWTSNQTGSPTDNLEQRVEAHDLKFAATTGGGGHAHTAVIGDGPNLTWISIAGIPLLGHFLQAADLMGVSGTSTDVSTEMSGKTPSTSSTVVGVVVNVPYNRTILRYASGPLEDDEILDVNGDQVYGRITELAGVWTLSYYTLVAGVEAPYNFMLATDIRWYYQELFPRIGPSAPVYSPIAFIPSENAMAIGSSLGFQEIPAGPTNGVNTTFGPLTFTPVDADSIIVFLDGIAQDESEWALSGSSVIFTTPPAFGQQVYVFYLYNGNIPPPFVPTGVENVEYRTLTGGEITAGQLTLVATPAAPSKVMLDVITGTSQEFNVDFTVASNTLIWMGYALDGVLVAGDKLRLHYWS